MKMISSTSTTSTSGVMLMSLRMPLAPPRTSIAIGHYSFPAPGIAAVLGAPCRPWSPLPPAGDPCANPRTQPSIDRSIAGIAGPVAGPWPAAPVGPLDGAHPGLDLLDHQADPAEAGLVDQPHHLAHPLVLQPAVALQHDLLVRCLVVNALQRPRHLAVGHPVLADEDAAVLLDRDGELLAVLRHLLGHLRLGQRDVDALLQHRRDDHEDDQQHQADVDQGSHVDLALDLLDEVRLNALGQHSGTSAS